MTAYPNVPAAYPVPLTIESNESGCRRNPCDFHLRGRRSHSHHSAAVVALSGVDDTAPEHIAPAGSNPTAAAFNRVGNCISLSPRMT